MGWEEWERVGGYLVSAPSAFSQRANSIDTFVRRSDNGIVRRSLDDGTWGDWGILGGPFTSAPAAVSLGPNRIDLFALGMNRAIYQKTWEGGAYGVGVWGNWEKVDGGGHRWMYGVAVSSETASTASPGSLDLFAIGTDRRLYQQSWNASGGWSGWRDLGGTFISAPAAVSWGPGRTDVFGIGGGSAVYHGWRDGTNWHVWEDLGGGVLMSYGVGVSSWGANRLDLFATGADSHVYRRWWDGNIGGPFPGWSGWEDLDGTFISAPTAVSGGRNRIDVFAIGTDAAMYHKIWTPY